MKQTEAADAVGGNICLESIKIETIVHEATCLLSYCQVCAELYRYIHTQDASSQAVKKLLTAEPNLAALLLKIANSLGPELKGNISTVDQALQVLTSEDIFNLIMGISTKRADEKIGDNFYSLLEYSDHCVFVGLCCKYLAIKFQLANADMFFMAGLLHDIGLPAIYSTRPQACKFLKEETKGNEIRLATCERKLFGFDHGELGAALLKRWQLPERLVKAIAYHHQPVNKPDSAILYLAELLAAASKSGQDPDVYIEQNTEYDLYKLLKVNKKSMNFNNIIKKVRKEKVRISLML